LLHFPSRFDWKKKNKIFTNTESGFGSLLKWLITLKIEPDQVTAIMEATSVYHENLGYYLYDAGVKVCVANPSRVEPLPKACPC
jgi:transposase